MLDSNERSEWVRISNKKTKTTESKLTKDIETEIQLVELCHSEGLPSDEEIETACWWH